jgi:hypothetical protein
MFIAEVNYVLQQLNISYADKRFDIYMTTSNIGCGNFIEISILQ